MASSQQTEYSHVSRALSTGELHAPLRRRSTAGTDRYPGDGSFDKLASTPQFVQAEGGEQSDSSPRLRKLLEWHSRRQTNRKFQMGEAEDLSPPATPTRTSPLIRRRFSMVEEFFSGRHRPPGTRHEHTIDDQEINLAVKRFVSESGDKMPEGDIMPTTTTAEEVRLVANAMGTLSSVDTLANKTNGILCWVIYRRVRMPSILAVRLMRVVVILEGAIIALYWKGISRPLRLSAIRSIRRGYARRLLLNDKIRPSETFVYTARKEIKESRRRRIRNKFRSIVRQIACTTDRHGFETQSSQVPDFPNFIPAVPLLLPVPASVPSSQVVSSRRHRKSRNRSVPGTISNKTDSNLSSLAINRVYESTDDEWGATSASACDFLDPSAVASDVDIRWALSLFFRAQPFPMMIVPQDEINREALIVTIRTFQSALKFPVASVHSDPLLSILGTRAEASPAVDGVASAESMEQEDSLRI